jgi:hypothetical protein
MGKAKRVAKKARKNDKALQAELEAQAESRRKKRRAVIIAVPVLTAAAAAAVWFGLESESGAGAVILGGIVVWLLVGLGYLGGSVRPRDRRGAGSIDFGARK